MAEQINESQCPLCQSNNFCGVDDEAGCWCTKEKVPQALIEQVPPHLTRKACICQKCIKKYHFDLAKQVK